MTHGRWGRRLRAFLLILLINITLLAALDGLLVAFDVLRPPIVYGDPVIGFMANRPIHTSAMLGNEEPFPDSTAVTIAMLGDSHSELGSLKRAMNRHQFVLESTLRAKGLPARILAAGRGRYAPLQEYMLFRMRIRDEYAPEVVVMNLYAGNDFYDMLRPDDRPHFRREADGEIVVADPIWMTFADPTQSKWRAESRVLWVLGKALGAVTYPRIISRLKALSITTRGLGGDWRSRIDYLRAVQRSIEPRLGYYAGFSAQILNQAIFYDFFPSGRAESMEYLGELLAMARRENPGTVFVMAPIPSAVLAESMPAEVRDIWSETLERVGMTEDEVRRTEQELYDELRDLCRENGWMFVDLLAAFLAEPDRSAFYDPGDLHVTEAACAVIGRAEAAALSRLDWSALAADD